MDEKTCKSCGQTKPLSEFYKERPRKDGTMLYRAECKECVKQRIAAHRSAHPMKARKRGLKYYRKIRLRALLHYSNGELKCACCGEPHVEFLCLDHVENNGAQHRRQMRSEHTDIFHWVHKNGYPDGFQVLCMNCNFAKGVFGQCIHELMRQGSYQPIDVPAYLKRTPPHHNSRSHLITYQDETHSLTEWAKKLGISERVLSTRINNHKWTIERAFTQQARPSRYVQMITYNGHTQSLRDWARELGISGDTIFMRLNRYGWSVEDTLTKPPRKSHKKGK